MESIQQVLIQFDDLGFPNALQRQLRVAALFGGEQIKLSTAWRAEAHMLIEVIVFLQQENSVYRLSSYEVTLTRWDQYQSVSRYSATANWCEAFGNVNWLQLDGDDPSAFPWNDAQSVISLLSQPGLTFTFEECCLLVDKWIDTALAQQSKLFAELKARCTERQRFFVFPHTELFTLREASRLLIHKWQKRHMKSAQVHASQGSKSPQKKRKSKHT